MVASACCNLSSFLWGWERLGRILSPLLWGRDEHRISPLKPFWESFKCVENTSTHSEPTFLEPGCISLLVTTGVYQVRMKMAETRTETWLPFRHKKKISGLGLYTSLRRFWLAWCSSQLWLTLRFLTKFCLLNWETEDRSWAVGTPPNHCHMVRNASDCSFFSAGCYLVLIVLLIIWKAAFCAWASVFPPVKWRGCIR